MVKIVYFSLLFSKTHFFSISRKRIISLLLYSSVATTNECLLNAASSPSARRPRFGRPDLRPTRPASTAHEREREKSRFGFLPCQRKCVQKRSVFPRAQIYVPGRRHDAYSGESIHRVAQLTVSREVTIERPRGTRSEKREHHHPKVQRTTLGIRRFPRRDEHATPLVRQSPRSKIRLRRPPSGQINRPAQRIHPRRT